MNRKALKQLDQSLAAQSTDDDDDNVHHLDFNP
jgi:hypothetical protein